MQRPNATKLIADRHPNVPDSPFWRSASIDELAQSQRVERVRSLDEFMGGWPESEVDDGFEEALAQWRQSELASAT